MNDRYKNLKPFPKGVSGNPGGKIKGALTGEQIRKNIARLFDMTRDELQAVIQDPKSTMHEIMLASIVAQAAKSGDYSRLEALYVRAVGKAKDVVEHTVSADDKDLFGPWKIKNPE